MSDDMGEHQVECDMLRASAVDISSLRGSDIDRIFGDQVYKDPIRDPHAMPASGAAGCGCDGDTCEHGREDHKHAATAGDDEDDLQSRLSHAYAAYTSNEEQDAGPDLEDRPTQRRKTQPKVPVKRSKQWR